MADDFLNPYAAPDDAAAGIALHNAATTPPDRAATVEKYAAALGLPPETVDRNYGEVERRAKTQAARVALESAPKTRAWIADPGNAAVAHDDVPHLAGLEGMIRKVFPGGLGSPERAPENVPSGAMNAIASTLRGVGDFAGVTERNVIDPVLRAFGVSPADVWGSDSAQALGRVAAKYPKIFTSLGKKTEFGPQDTLAAQLGQGAGQLGVQAAGAVAAPEALIPSLLAQSADPIAREAEKAGKAGTANADLALVLGSGGQAFLEKIGLDKVLEAVPAAARGKLLAGVATILGKAGVEGGTEAAQQLVQNAVVKALINPDQALGADVLSSGIVGGLLGGGAGSAQVAHADLRDRANAAARAREQAAGLDKLAEAVKASPMRERAPDRLESLLAAATDGEDVYIPSEAMATYLQTLSPEDQQAFVEATGIADQLNAELPAGADFVMPASRYLLRVAPTDAHAALSKDVRVGLGGQSLNEAEAFEADKADLIDREGERVVAETRAAEAKAAPVTRVFNEAFSQFRQAGYTIDAARSYATLWAHRYEARAARLPDSYPDAYAAYKASGVKVQAVAPAQLARSVGRLDLVADELRSSRAAPKPGEGPSLLRFLSKAGGLKDGGGELSAMDAEKWHVGKPGTRQLVNAEGLDIEDAAMRAWEHGYLPGDEQPEPGDLLDAIREELAGKARYAAPLDQRKADFARAVEQLGELLDREGIDPKTATNDQIKEAVAAYQTAEEERDGRQYEQPPQKLVDLTLQARKLREARNSAPNAEAWEKAHKALLPIADQLAKETGSPLGLDSEDVAAGYGATNEEFSPDADLIKSAVEFFGVTRNPEAAGYILPDGRMLDLSEEGGDGSRTQDHRAVGAVDGVEGSGADAMAEFMNRTGAVRVDFSSGLFEAQRAPTTKAIRAAVKAARDLDKSLLLEASRPDGSPKASLDLDRPTADAVAKFFEREAAGRTFFQMAGQKADAFKAWFGDSKVVDKNGDPLVVYHGTTGDFEAFDAKQLGANTGAESAKGGFFFTDDTRTAASYAYYAATDARVMALVNAAQEAERKGDWDAYDELTRKSEELDASFNDTQNRMAGQNVMPVYLSIQNPLVVDAKGENAVGFDIPKAIRDAVRGGHDGVIIRTLDDAAGLSDQVADHYIAFKPTQIKSTMNRGTYDPADPRILYQMAGQGAAIAPREELARAQDMEAAGELSGIIQDETGWQRGDDGFWRFEISDDKAEFKKRGLERLKELFFLDTDRRGMQFVPLGELLDHKELFDAYPEMKSYGVMVVAMRANAGWSPELGIALGERLVKDALQDDAGKAKMLSSLLHEVQHGIQFIEGHANGASASPASLRATGYGEELQAEIDQLIEDEVDLEQYMIEREAAFRVYQRSAGEIEARNTQARQTMTAQGRRDLPPDFTRDIPRDKAIVRLKVAGKSYDIPVSRSFDQPAFHGSRLLSLSELKVSERGPFGSATYLSPNESVAKRYAGPEGRVYEAEVPDAIFHGLKSRDSSINPYEVWRRQVAALSAAADPAIREELEAVAAKMQPGDGYPFFARISQLVGSQEAAQDLFKAAGFIGISGDIDGPEIALFDGVPAAWMRQRMEQSARGSVTFGNGEALIRLFAGRDLSTLLHEGGHLWLEELQADAADPNAPDQLKEDLATVRAWMGVAEGAPIEVVHHEMFARAVEHYLREGRAPIPSLRGAFQRFAAWLAKIYKRADALNISVSPQMRNVFDRLIATDAAIDAAKANMDLNPFFASAADGGMTQAEFAALNRAIDKADEAARAKLLRKAMKPIREATTQAWRDEWQDIYEDSLAEVDSTPAIRALAFIKENRQPISREAVVDIFGSEAALARLPKMVPAIYTAGGVHPDAIAQATGSSSGEAMLLDLMAHEAERQAMREAGDKRSVRESRAARMADEEMKARHGDALTDGSMEAEALDAVNDLLRISLENTHVRYLARMAGEPEGKWTTTGLKAWAERTVADRKASGIKPGLYLRAERSAANEAIRAHQAGKAAEALDAKWRQVANMHLYRAAKDAEEEVERIASVFSRIVSGKDASLSKTRNMDLVNGARAVLEAYGYTRVKNSPSAYMEMVKEYDPDAYAAINPMVIQATENAKAYDDLTLSELTTLSGLVEQMWALSRRSKVIEIEGRLVEIAEATAALTEDLAVRGEPPQAPGLDRAVTEREKLLNEIAGIGALITKTEEWASRMGANFTRYIWRPVSKAADAWRADRQLYIPKLIDALEAVKADQNRSYRIDAPELNYVFGYEKGAGMAELLGALRHAGNKSNLRKLLLGRGWGIDGPDGEVDTSRWDAFLSRMHREGVLEKRHWDYVQAEWDLHEEIKPLAQKAHRAIYGRYFSEITADPVETPFGTYAGGYVAAKVDPNISRDAQMRVDEASILGGNSGTFMFPTPANGFTKGRVEYNAPLDLDIRLAVSQMDEVLRFAHLGPAVRDVNRLLMDKAFAATLGAYEPVAWRGLLLPWLTRSVSQRTSTPTQGPGGKLVDKYVGGIGRNAAMTLMFGSLTNTAQQITGFPAATLRTGKRNMAEAFGAFLKNPAGIAQAVADASPLMRVRQSTQLDELRELADEIVTNPNLYQKAVTWTAKHTYFLQHAMQNVMDPIIWTAARSRAMELGEADPDGYADMVIRTTQGTHNAEDVSRFTTGPTWAKPFKMFSGFFIDQGNMLNTEWIKAGSMGRRAEVYAMGFMVPAVLAKLIAEGLSGRLDGEDGWGDELFDILFMSQVQYALAMFPVAGQAVNLLINRFDDKPYNDNLSLSPAASMAETAVGAPKSVAKAMSGEGGEAKAVRDVFTALSFITGLPFSFIGKPLAYGVGVAAGEIAPTSAADAARGAVTGTASPASKGQ